MSKISRALISVSDKTGLEVLGRYLAETDVEILSTGGTAEALRDLGLTVKDVSDETGFPEIMDGRVKTLHPKIHGGILARRDDDGHQAAMRDNAIGPIDLLVVNLYPFEETLAGGAGFEDCIENIDIGGPALIRAAAKNHEFVTVVVDPGDYAQVIEEMKAGDGSTTPEFRKRLAARAYGRTGAYDAAISGWFQGQIGEPFPPHIAVGARLKQLLRYGENPHQQAAFYVGGERRPGVATAEQIQGKELSYNNLGDTDAAFELVSEFTGKAACAIIKHANPCGVAVADSLIEAYARALACDTESAFGGIIAVNQTLDAATAGEIAKLFAEVVIAPDIDPEARKLRSAWEEQVSGPLTTASEKIAKARFLALGDSIYPDATFTLRLSYGKIAGWTYRGTEVPPFTHFAGLYERATGHEPYKLDPRWIAAKDKPDLSTIFDISTTNDIIGGNSGSPLINAKGEAIGTVFDGNIHSLGGNYGYDAKLNRTVAVSAAAINEALRKVYGADAIADELTGKHKPS